MRDFDSEAKEQAGKKYNYNFDGIVRDYMMRTFQPHFGAGPALEIGCYRFESWVPVHEGCHWVSSS